MKEIEVTIPTRVEDITLEQYQEFVAASEGLQDATEEDMIKLVLRAFCGVDDNMLRLLQMNQIEDIITRLNPILDVISEAKYELVPRFTLNDVEYGFIPNIDKISFGENHDTNESLYNIQDLHMALAVLYRPIVDTQGDKYSIEEYTGDTQYNQKDIMKSVPINVALGMQVFFWTLIKDLREHIQSYSQNV